MSDSCFRNLAEDRSGVNLKDLVHDPSLWVFAFCFFISHNQPEEVKKKKHIKQHLLAHRRLFQSPWTNLKSTSKKMHRSVCACVSVCVCVRALVFFLRNSVTKKLKISLPHNMSGLGVALWRKKFPACMATTKGAAALSCLRMALCICKKSLFAQRIQRRWNQQLFPSQRSVKSTPGKKRKQSFPSRSSFMNVCVLLENWNLAMEKLKINHDF